MKALKIFSGNANRKMAREITEHLSVPLGKAEVKQFSDGEIWVEIKENVRGADVFVVQPTCAPVNDNLMELVIMADALRRASARRITAVMPYYGYARQDAKKGPRVPISARVIADIIEIVGIRRVLTMDLHAGQIQGFFKIPVDHLYSSAIFFRPLKDKFPDAVNLVMVSPDAGGVERTRHFAKLLGAGLAIIDKRRDKPNEVEEMKVIGNVRGQTAVLLDDMVDTAGTLCKAAAALIENGAKEVHACCAHPVLSGTAIEKLSASCIESLIVSNSIPLRENALAWGKIEVISASGMMADAIRAVYSEGSVSDLFI